MRSVALSPAAREEALQAMADTELDVLVNGGGVVGAGSALDAATRGLSVGLVEARDFASGTSSRSSKLIHGGLRYLEMLDFRLVAEALAERGLLIETLAPHLVRPVPFLYPLKHRGWERLYAGSGVALYDTLSLLSGRSRGVPHHRHLTRRGALRVMPSLRKDSLVGALQYYDGQVDDARHTVFIARTAAAYGAHVANRARVTGLLREGERVVGAVVHDQESGASLRIRAQQVVNATGVWTDDTQSFAGERGQFHVRASKGIHLVVPRDRIRGDSGLILRTEKSVLFVIPWGRHWIVGTTDTDWSLDRAHPAASAADIQYLLDHVNRVIEPPLTHEDVEGVYAGLRPLARGKDEPTSRISREHTVVAPVPGLVLVAGGKLTTYRVMAQDAVDAAARSLERSGQHVGPSITDRVPLLGAAGFEARTNQRVALARSSGLPVARIDHLLGRYGGLVDEVLAVVARDPSLGEPLDGTADYLAGEVVYAVTHEGARHLDDVLTRRTRISIETFDRGTTSARPAAALMAGVLGWDATRVDEEVDHYLRRVEAERQSQQKATDQEADEARVSAPDIV